MVVKHLTVAVCFFISFNCIEAIETVNGKIKITVGTTSGCGDTVNFIATQLVPTYAQYKDYLDIEFVPWGRTVRHPDDSKTCQFGENDCWANRLHRCALYFLQGNLDGQVNYMNCEFTSPFPSFLQGSYTCAEQVGLNINVINFCVNVNGRFLDDVAQEAAREPMTIINFVPTIHFNDVIDIPNHHQARTGLSQMICSALAADPGTGIIDC